MKKLLTALILATSFAAFADDAPKADTSKSGKKSKKAKKSTKADHPGRRCGPPRSKRPASFAVHARACSTESCSGAARPVVVSGHPGPAA